jgi:hypothetical protein
MKLGRTPKKVISGISKIPVRTWAMLRNRANMLLLIGIIIDLN